MQKTVYEDYKYSMQDTSHIYIGCKYSFRELLDDEGLLFKFRMIVERYILPEADLEDTLEHHLYHLSGESFLIRIYKQMKAKVKVNMLEEKKSLFGKSQKGYVTKQFTVEQLAAMTPAEKEACGLVVQELCVSKLAMLSL